MPQERTVFAEYVSPGHPDRLADGIAEGIVDAAVAADPDALVGVEVAVHTDKVFIDGRVAAGAGETCGLTQADVERLALSVYSDAGYGKDWAPAPSELKITTDLCLGPLEPAEREARAFADDQNVVVGYACRSPETEDLPAAHWLAWELGRRLVALRRNEAPGELGPDFKLLPLLTESRDGGRRRLIWRQLTMSIQHRPGMGYEEQHRILLPAIESMLQEMEGGGLAGVAATFRPELLVLNGAGGFEQGGPHGDNGLSGKKLVVDHYGPSVPIGGGAMCGKDPHKIDRCGPLRARQWARQMLQSEGAAEARTTLLWAPGSSTPHHIEAQVADDFGVWRHVPPSRYPPLDWFSITAIVADLDLAATEWCATTLRGQMRGSPARL